MMAMLLIAQLSAQAPTIPAAQLVLPDRRPEVVGLLLARSKAHPCISNLGRMEVSLAQPTALYRQGDRPAKGLKDWVAYPEPQLCLIGAMR